MRVTGSPSLLLALLVCLGAPRAAHAQLGDYQVMHALSGDDGSGPQSGLVRGADDRLYGTATYGGGPNGAGTIYRIASNGTFRVIHTFLTTAPAGGLNPVSLIRGRDNHLYGTTEYGGTIGGTAVDASGNPIGDGVIYRLNWDATRKTYDGVTVLYTFDCSKGASGDPWGQLVEGPDGALYGVTAPSSSPDPDPDCTEPTAVFKVNKDGSGFAVLAKFEYLVSGAYQFGPLAFGTDGSIFGTLIDSFNPVFQFGSIFKIAPNGVVSYPKIFDRTDGARPYSGLVPGVDGAFYGTTSEGGAHDVGTIFRIDESGTFTSLYSFDSASIHTPFSSLVAGGDGKLYGAAHAGGGTTCNCGGSYVFDPLAPIGSGTGFTLHAMFDHTITGSVPWGILGVGVDRHLYGTQSLGGVGDQGTLFGLVDLTVAPRPPVPIALAFPNPAEAQSVDGATVSLNALGSWDADFDDLTYSWTLPASVTNVVEAADHSTVEATFPVTAPGPPLNVTLSVSDGTSTRSVTIAITVIDAPPVFSAVETMSVLAPNLAGVAVNYSVPTATDTIDGELPATCLPSSGSVFPVGSTTVDCSVSDSRGNPAETSFVVTVTVDTTPPIISAPLMILAEATSSSGAVVTYNVSASDDLGVPSVSCTPASGFAFALGITTVRCTAINAANLESEDSFDVVVDDTTGPVITVPASITVITVSPAGANVTYPVASAIDLVDGITSVSCSPASGSLFPLGTTTVTCTSSDTRANSSARSFTVTVANTPPTLAVTLSPGVLWPPNHKMVTITATIHATSHVGTPVVTLVNVESNEPDNGLGEGDMPRDIQGHAIGTEDREFQLRAERSGRGKGRVYRVTYTATIPNSTLQTTVTATVTVPHAMNGKK